MQGGCAWEDNLFVARDWATRGLDGAAEEYEAARVARQPPDARRVRRISQTHSPLSLRPIARQRLIIGCLFADARRGGLNFEDIRPTCRRKLALLTAIVAIAWVGAAGQRLLGRRRLPRKAHGYPAKFDFHIGFDRLRTLLRADLIRTLDAWISLPPTPKCEKSSRRLPTPNENL